jgi:DNA-directed RNA polymerase subunit RPC12/RpoP
MRTEKPDTPACLILHMEETIHSVSDVLLRSGARINMSSPPDTRLDRETPIGCFALHQSLELQEVSGSSIIDRKGLKMDDDATISLLGGKERVKASQKCFSSMPKAVNGRSGASLNVQTDLSSIVDSTESGGSDSNSCAICWSEFGVISNRKQFCQVSTRYLCNDCSTKRLVDEGKDVRVSDGQFLLAKAQEAKAINNLKTNPKAAAGAGAGRGGTAPNPETKNRISLGLFNKASNSGKDAKSEQPTSEKVTSAVSALGQARDAVLQRGSKLEGLADKTDALSQASLDFANMAKELNRQQNSWW